MRRIDVSVTALAQFACRQGDLVADRIAGPTAAEGIRAHQRLQKQLLEQSSQNTRAEVEAAIACDCKVGDQHIRMTGRLDYLDRDASRIQEIKSTLVPSNRIPESQRSLHWAQLYLYAFIFTEQQKQALPEIMDSASNPESADLESEDHEPENLEQENPEPENPAGGQKAEHKRQQSDQSCRSALAWTRTPAGTNTPELRLIYVNLRDGSVETLIRTPDSEEIERFALGVLSVYVDWSRKLDALNKRMIASAQALKFPYTFFRSGQRDMAVAVYKACRDAHPLLCEAATGIGKTISSLFPAVKCLGERHIRQVVYLVAKVSGGTSVLKALHQLNTTDQTLRAIQIKARQASCFCLTGRCERDEQGSCPMTVGFYDRLPAAREALIEQGIIDAEQLLDTAWNYQLCPFALTQQMLPWMHVVIADYNYVFDPLVRLPYFSTAKKDVLLIVDEAHNLPDRARQMFSGSLLSSVCAEQYQAGMSSYQGLDTLVTRELKQLCAMLVSMSRRYHQGENLIEDRYTGQHAQLYRCASRLTRLLMEDPDSLISDSELRTGGPADRAISRDVQIQSDIFIEKPASEARRGISNEDFFRMLCRYTAIGQLYNESYNSLLAVAGDGHDGDVRLDLVCMDASNFLAQQYRQYKSVALFSATLHPASFYKTTLGLPDETDYLRLPSPFDSTRGYTAIVDWIDTRYRQREASLDSLTELIARVISNKSGNYIVFFPSYQYLEDAFRRFTTLFPEIKSWKQSRGEDSRSQASKIEQLSDTTLGVGFAIQGGIYAEGIDYVGDALIGVIIVGTGLPGLDLRTQLLADQFEMQGLSGFDYAYRYPAMTRVLQTAGRVIRDELDRGIILLVDDRFAYRDNRQLLMPHWQLHKPQNIAELSQSIAGFWSVSSERRNFEGTVPD